MAIAALCRFAASAPVAVFAAVGQDALERVEDLSLDATIDLVTSPRHAAVLLVAGKVRNDDRQALRTLHDQLPGLRATLWWGADPFDGMAAPVTLALSEDPVPTLHDLNRRLYAGTLETEPNLMPDEPPASWRGVGDHGQGGKGMMGGKPYGRPMAMTGDDRRDGLSLDEYTLQVGPFMPTLPPGLVLELVLQGDVIQTARLIRPPLLPEREGRGERSAASLRSAARLLTTLQLGAYAERCRRAAAALEHGDNVDVASLRRTLRRAGAHTAIPPDLGRCRLDGVESDVRARLDEWLGVAEHASHVEPASAATVDPPWPDLLSGLEWNEAMLVVNSLTPAQLRLVEPVADEAEAHPSPEHEH